MSYIIQIRRDTALNFFNANPLLAQGEPALEIDTLKEKIGDGINLYNDLPFRFISPQSSSFTFEQPIPSASWNIVHNLGKFPSVTIVDTAGNEVEGGVNHINNNNLIITFSAVFSGNAYLN